MENDEKRENKQDRKKKKYGFVLFAIKVVEFLRKIRRNRINIQEN